MAEAERSTNEGYRRMMQLLEKLNSDVREVQLSHEQVLEHNNSVTGLINSFDEIQRRLVRVSTEVKP